MIFVDTSFFYALFSARDRDHERVRRVLETFRGQTLRDRLLTTNHVVAETITLVRKTPPRRHNDAVRIGEALYQESLAQIYWTTPEDERRAFSFLKRFDDKEYSFVDCLSFVVMDQLAIQEALTLDSDFGHHFVVRPGPG